MRFTDPNKQNTRVNRCSHKGQAVSIYYKTLMVLLIFKFGKGLVGGRGRKNGRSMEKIHCHFRNGYFVTVNQFQQRSNVAWCGYLLCQQLSSFQKIAVLGMLNLEYFKQTLSYRVVNIAQLK